MTAALESGETGIFFESPHRILSTLEILTEIAPEAKICVARELTKKFETYHRGTPGELLDWFQSHGTKGEMVILMNGA